ncbi:MAG: hypothetical protein MUO88_12260, partial [Desulfobacterales bacterium]|nr:hypothetical protein [Desulfobacterales bacterium]
GEIWMVTNQIWDWVMGYGKRVWGCSTLHFYYAKNVGEGYFPAMEIMHKKNSTIFVERYHNL